VSSIDFVRSGRKLFVGETLLGDQSVEPSMNILMAHGSCAASSTYNNLLESVSKEIKGIQPSCSVKCTLYDTFGCGKSCPPKRGKFEDYSPHEDFLDFQALVKKLDPSTPLLLVGHSFATNQILRLLLDNTVITEITGAVLLAPGFKGGAFPQQDGGHAIFKMPLFFLNLMQKSLTKAFVKNAFHQNSKQALKTKAFEDSMKNDMFMCKAWYQQMTWITEEEVEKAGKQNPFLVIHGKNDGLIPCTSGKSLSGLLGAEFVEISQASHQVMEEKPTDVAKAIVSFMMKVGGL